MDMLPLAQPTAAPVAFDFSAMPEDVAARQRARAAKIADIQRRTVEAAGEIGRELLAAQAELEHGQFLPWVEAATGFSKSTAYRFMDIARSLGDKLPTVGNLPMTVIHKLAEKSTPEPVRAAVLKRIDAGETIAPEQILEEVREAKETARKQAAEDREAARRAALSDERRAKEDALNKRRGRTKAARDAELEAERLERALAMERRAALEAEAAKVFVQTFGAEGALAFMARFGGGDFWRKAKKLALVEQSKHVAPIEVPRREIWTPLWYQGWFTEPQEQREARLAMVEELRRDGLKEPIILTLNDDPEDKDRGKYLLVDGRLRNEAATQLGWQTIMARIVLPIEVSPRS